MDVSDLRIDLAVTVRTMPNGVVITVVPGTAHRGTGVGLPDVADPKVVMGVDWGVPGTDKTVLIHPPEEPPKMETEPWHPARASARPRVFYTDMVCLVRSSRGICTLQNEEDTVQMRVHDAAEYFAEGGRYRITFGPVD